MSKLFLLLLCIINLSVYSAELLTDEEVTNFRKIFAKEIKSIKKDEKITYEAIAIIKLVSKYLDMINGCSLDDSLTSKLYSLNKNKKNTNEYLKQSIWTNNYLQNLSKSILEGVGSKGIKNVKIKQNEVNIYEKSIIDIGKYTNFKIEKIKTLLSLPMQRK